MACNTNLNSGVQAAPGMPLTGESLGESLIPVRQSSGKMNSQKCEHCNGAGTVTKGIGGA